MAVRSKQMIVHGVALRSFTGVEGRLRPGMRFETTIARLEYLSSIGLAKEHAKTKAIAGPPETKLVPADDTPLESKPKAKPKSMKGKSKSKK